jgi:hypothetical protein
LARSRAYALFRAVQLSIHTALAVYLYRVLVELRPVFWLLNAIVLVSALALIRPADRGRLYRWTVSLPAAFYQSSTFFALPWALLSLFGVELGAPWLPLAFGTLGVVQSLRAPEETVELRLGSVAIGPRAPSDPGRSVSFRSPIRTWDRLCLLRGFDGFASALWSETRT